MTQIRVMRDIGFTVMVDNTTNTHVVNYKVYRHTDPGNDDIHVHYRREGGDNSMDTTMDIHQAEVIAEGNVKWDGCSNWLFEQNAWTHFCDRRMITQFGAVMDRRWDMTAEYCVHWAPC